VMVNAAAVPVSGGGEKLLRSIEYNLDAIF
jgi:hypothetical protein